MTLCSNLLLTRLMLVVSYVYCTYTKNRATSRSYRLLIDSVLYYIFVALSGQKLLLQLTTTASELFKKVCIMPVMLERRLPTVSAVNCLILRRMTERV